MAVHRIVTDFESTPACWSARLESYDGAPDTKGPDSFTGYGPSEVSAVADLLEQISEWNLSRLPGSRASKIENALREVLENRDGQIVHRAALERAAAALEGGR